MSSTSKKLCRFLLLSLVGVCSPTTFSSAGPQETAGPRPTLTAAAPKVESGFVEVNGGRLFYETAGHGLVIVMVHDGLLHRETWDAQFSAFAESYRVIRWDRRGYGRSEPPRAPYAHLDDFLAVFDALQVDRAIVMACSAGGLLSIHFALDHPERVSALVLVGPIVSGLGFSDHFLARGDRGRPGNDASPQAKVEYWTAKDPWILAPESSAAKQRMRELLEANPQNWAQYPQHERWPKGAAVPRLGQVKVPTLLVVGEADIPDVHTHVGAIQAGIASAKRVVLAHSGHLPHLEVPETFNRVVLDFLREVK